MTSSTERYISMPDVHIVDVQRASFVDGPGIRTVVFFKGCNLRCAWCHNPESWERAPQLLFYQSRCVSCGTCQSACPCQAIRADFYPARDLCTGCGACVSACPQGARVLCGRTTSIEALLPILSADRPFYAASGGGVTFSGGECMLQLDALCALLEGLKAIGIHTAIDTAGDVPFDAFERVLPLTDLFLYDIKAIDPTRHKDWTGADNRRILANYRRLHSLAPNKVWVRIPIIPGKTEEELPHIEAFLQDYPPARLERLPYHALGEGKAKALGQDIRPSITDASPDYPKHQ